MHGAIPPLLIHIHSAVTKYSEILLLLSRVPGSNMDAVTSCTEDLRGLTHALRRTAWLPYSRPATPLRCFPHRRQKEHGGTGASSKPAA